MRTGVPPLGKGFIDLWKERSLGDSTVRVSKSSWDLGAMKLKHKLRLCHHHVKNMSVFHLQNESCNHRVTHIMRY